MAWEQLLVLLFFVGLPLIQALMRRLKNDPRQPQDSSAPPPAGREGDNGSSWEEDSPFFDPVVFLPQSPPTTVELPPPLHREAAVPTVLQPRPSLRDVSPRGDRSPFGMPRVGVPRVGVPRMGGPVEVIHPRAIKHFLRQRGGLRQAVLLNAIVDKPPSLRPPTMD
jgi:hypothetical protein